MSPRNDLTAEEVRRLLAYDPITGTLTWRVARNKNQFAAGDEAGTVRKDGYRTVRINGRMYLAHRLAFVIMVGRWPIGLIDHRKGGSNAWDNLREATHSENGTNKKLQANNRSGRAGVFWNNQRHVWWATIRFRNRTKFLGSFANFDDAVATRAAAEPIVHGEFSPWSPT